MNRRAVRAFARGFRKELESRGIAALERFDWAEGFSELGFEMDCGRSYEEAYGLSLGSARDIGEGPSRVDGVAVLGNAIFSQCRYLTHRSYGYGEDNAAWLVAALGRLEELAIPGNAPGMVVAYRFKDAVKEAVRSFCKHALSDEEQPAFVEYGVRDTGALDAYVDEVSCAIDLPGGDVSLTLEVIQTAWRHPGQTPGDLAPAVASMRAERVVEDEETGNEVALAGMTGAVAGCPQSAPEPCTATRCRCGRVGSRHGLRVRLAGRVRRPLRTADRMRAGDPRGAAARTAARRVRATGRARGAADMAPIYLAAGHGRIPCVAESGHAKPDRLGGLPEPR